MREALAKLIDAVEALTRHAPVGSPSHAMIAEAKTLFAAPETPPEQASDPSLKPTRGTGRTPQNTTEEHS